ncbi:MAG: heavy-metal-associated domain-containing protein [archaeon]|nr:heavy-metal-associated domain-containing protein [archaeon]
MATNEDKEKKKRVILTIPFTGCIDCNIANIEYNLKNLDGVKNVKAKMWMFHIDYYPSKVSINEIKKAIVEMGYVISK